MHDEGADYRFHHGRVSLSFVGTIGDRASERTERVPTPAALGAWFVAAGLLPRAPQVTARTYARALELRAAIESVSAAVLAKKKPPATAIATINAVAKRAPRRELDAGLRLVDDARDPAGAALATVAADAIAWLGDPGERDRLRTCGQDTCGSLFLTPAGRRERRWCSMERCGNRAKVSAFRERAHLA
jgi:predicted RNA-binding Zn ribbon-like protein